MRGRVFGGEEYSEGTTKARGACRSNTKLDFGVFFFRRKWGVPGKVFQERKDVAGGSGRLGRGRTDWRENGASAAALGGEDDLPRKP